MHPLVATTCVHCFYFLSASFFQKSVSDFSILGIACHIFYLFHEYKNKPAPYLTILTANGRSLKEMEKRDKLWGSPCFTSNIWLPLLRVSQQCLWDSLCLIQWVLES